MVAITNMWRWTVDRQLVSFTNKSGEEELFAVDFIHHQIVATRRDCAIAVIYIDSIICSMYSAV